MCLWLLFLAAGCSGFGGEPEDKAPEENTPTEKEYGMIIVDNLRMRDQGNLQGKEITQIGINQIVSVTGKRTDSPEVITMSGKNDPYYWHEITFNGDTGWVYGGGIRIMDSETMNDEILNDFLIVPKERVGSIEAGIDHEGLVRRLGEAQVIKDEIPLGDGESVSGTVLYPNSNNEIMIYWQNADFTKIRQVVITKPGGDWHTGQGIHIGTSIEEVNRINGRPFELMGFDWEYSGTTLNWQSGHLDSSVKLSFDYSGEISVYPFLLGDKVISSDNSSLLKLNPKVRRISVSFN